MRFAASVPNPEKREQLDFFFSSSSKGTVLWNLDLSFTSIFAHSNPPYS
jgi:hypothetical protein